MSDNAPTPPPTDTPEACPECGRQRHHQECSRYMVPGEDARAPTLAALRTSPDRAPCPDCGSPGGDCNPDDVSPDTARTYAQGVRDGRERTLTLARKIAESTHANAVALRKYPSSAVEARCREWAGLVLDEIAECLVLGDRREAFNAKTDALMAEVRALLNDTPGEEEQ